MRTRLITILVIPVFLATLETALAQANLPIYTDNLVNGFQDWSWATRNMANTTPVHAGSRSISVTTTANTGISFYHYNFNTTPYANFSFWAHGGTGGGQRLQVYVQYGASSSGSTYTLPSTLTAGTWTQYSIPLTTLGVANRANVNRINILLAGTGTTNTFYLDDVQIGAAAAPALVHLSINTNTALRKADARWFGLNTAIWDSNFDTASTSNAMEELNCQILRFPGGSLSDFYHWATATRHDGYSYDPTKFTNFVHVATNAGVQAMITVNYGTGTSNEAAAWVRHANVTNNYAFKFWEIGNECYGTWEIDSNSLPHDPFTYATRAANYITLMKAADPTIKIGVVAAPGESSFSNNATHYAVNSRTGTTNYGWTPVMLATLKNLGVTPDYIVHHVYPEYTGGESDPLLLQSAVNWAADAADLRQQLVDYMGASNTNIEILCTENNSNSGNQGRQSTSIVNGLYLADSLGQLMKTEIDAYVWWDLRNGTDTSGSFDATLYGWRTYGDLGIMSGATNKYPAYYSMKLMQYLAQQGDTVLNPTSDYLLLSTYAVLKTNGNLAVLVINKDAVTNLTAQIAVTGFTPASSATVRSYAIQQDEATRTNGPGALKDLQTNTVAVSALFTNTFPPYSMTLYTFTPSGSTPKVTTLSLSSGANPSTYGSAVTFTATVRTNGVAVGDISGQTVTFYHSAAQLGTGTLNGSGQATYATSATQLPAGTLSITAGYTGSAVYAGSTNSPALSQTVNQATVTAGLTGTVAKNYNATTAAALAPGNYTLSGVFGGDTVTLNNPTSGTYDNDNFGTGKTVNVSGLSISGASAANYALASTSVSGAVGTINQTNLTVTASVNSKPYDTTLAAAAAPAITYGGLQAGDTATFTESYLTKTVGTGKTLVPAGSVNDGNGGNNYSVTFVNNTAGVITEAGLTISGVTAADKVYDGTTNATLTGAAVLNGVIGSDDVTLVTSGAAAFFADASVGTNKPVTVTGYSVTGTDSGNYSLTQPGGLLADILALATPAFVGSGISATAGGWQLDFTGQSGQTYQVLATGDLSVPLNLWTVVTNGTFGTGTEAVTDNVTNLPTRFYRIVSP
jgi:alpha-L-arabinofuranosidase